MDRFVLYSIAVKDTQSGKFVLLAEKNGEPKEWEKVNLKEALKKAVEEHGDSNVRLFAKKRYEAEIKISWDPEK